MIRRISASDHRFRSFELQPGFNLIVAQRSSGATRRDSTNALGKSCVLRIIHFLLGAEPKKGKEVPEVPALKGWTFKMDLDLNGRPVCVSRATGSNAYFVYPCPPGWGEPQIDGSVKLTIAEWKALLRQQVFGIPSDAVGPSVRQILPYLIRYESAHFAHAFEILNRTAQSRVASAWLLGLPVSAPLEFEELEARRKELQAIKSRIETTGYPGLKATRPALQAEQARLAGLVRKLESERSRYELKEHSLAIKARADGLTKQFNGFRDDIAETAALITHYQSAASAEAMPADAGLVAALYAEVDVWLPEKVSRRLAEVQQFHEMLITNRARFLANKVRELTTRQTELQAAAARIDAARAPLLAALAEDGAIEAYTATQTELIDARHDLATVEAQLAMLNGVEVEIQQVDEAQRQLTQRAAILHDEYLNVQNRAQALFSEFVRTAFHEEGRLEIDLTNPRYRFDTAIPSKSSGGVGKLAIAGVDLTIARLLHERKTGPHLLVHDSAMFESMDTRQVVGTLNTAWHESSAFGYTYLALLNEDQFRAAAADLQLPDIDSYIRLRLRDNDPAGGLFGFRFG